MTMQRIPMFDLPANPINPFPEINWFEFASEMLARYNPDSHYCQRCHKEIWADKIVTSYPRGFVWPCNGRSRTDTLYIPVILCRECGKPADGKGPDSGDYNHAILGGIIIPFTKYSLPFVLTVLDSYANRTGTVEDVCEQWGICRNTLYNWIGRHMEQYDLWADSLHGTGSLGREAQSRHPGSKNLYSRILAAALGLVSHILPIVISGFFGKYGYSFMQPSKKTHLRPPLTRRRP